MKKKRIADVPVVYHEIETNGIGYVDVLFDMSGVEEADSSVCRNPARVLGVIDTENYKYGELFNEINVHTGGIGTSLELYTDISKVPEKEFKATFEIKGKALYQKLPVVFRMMEEILTRSKLGDTKRIREIPCDAKVKTSYEIPVIRTYNSSASCDVLCISVI